MSSPPVVTDTKSEDPPPYYPPSQPVPQPGGVYQPQPGVAYQPQPADTYHPQPAGAVTTTTVITQPGAPVIASVLYGSNPMNIVCPYCQATVVTSISTTPGALPWLLCCGCALFGCWLGCCLIPFCIPDLYDCRHTCPNCKKFLGTYRRL